MEQKVMVEVEKVTEAEYRETIKETIMSYVKDNPAENCTRKNLLTHVANNSDVQNKRRKRYQSKRSKEDAYAKPANNARYELMFRIALGELIEEKKIERLKLEKKHPMYVLSESEAKIYSLCNNEIAIFEVGEGREKSVKSKIEEFIEDKQIVIIPVNGFLLCTKRNPENLNKEESQLEHIRVQVEKAIITAYGAVYLEPPVEESNEKSN